jgi:two-component system LytT family response regulator
VVIRDQNQIRIIPVNDIHYIEAQGDYVKIQTGNASYLKKKTMQYFEDTLDPQLFVRVHRSYIIQMAQIIRIDPYDKESYTAVLKSGIQIPLSRNGYTRLKATLGI